MEEAKQRRDELYGWISPNNDEVRRDGSTYPSPQGFYEKLGFDILFDEKYETDKISAIKIHWRKETNLLDMDFTPEQIKKIAAQLRRPHGEDGIEMGHRMAEGNATMITDAIDALEVRREITSSSWATATATTWDNYSPRRKT